jgi:curved DNA-binding protein CbpA
MDHDEEVTRILSCNSHFEVLSVTKHSTNEEVKRSFRTLALRTHPDKNKHVHATEAFKRVTGAFQSLDTQEKRTMYHARGGRGFANHTEHHHHDDDDESDDVFKFFNMFMRSGGFGQGADFGRGERGVSIHDLMMLMMMRDLMFGGGGGGGLLFLALFSCGKIKRGKLTKKQQKDSITTRTTKTNITKTTMKMMNITTKRRRRKKRNTMPPKEMESSKNLLESLSVGHAT